AGSPVATSTARATAAGSPASTPGTATTPCSSPVGAIPRTGATTRHPAIRNAATTAPPRPPLAPVTSTLRSVMRAPYRVFLRSWWQAVAQDGGSPPKLAQSLGLPGLRGLRRPRHRTRRRQRASGPPGPPGGDAAGLSPGDEAELLQRWLRGDVA